MMITSPKLVSVKFRLRIAPQVFSKSDGRDFVSNETIV
jgi:hypothetical protein